VPASLVARLGASSFAVGHAAETDGARSVRFGLRRVDAHGACELSTHEACDFYGSYLPPLEHDEEANTHLHTDVVHGAPVSGPTPVVRWVEAMRRLNGILDPFGPPNPGGAPGLRIRVRRLRWL
jgi:hypothetical protein